MNATTLSSTISLYTYYKNLGEKAMAQCDDAALFYVPDAKSNSISVIIRHLHGNMLSRWTDFLTSDGEKEWRQRDQEFEETPATRAEIMQLWEEGWNCVFAALNQLTPADMETIVYIRNMGQTVEEAVMRQLAHYAYHVGQIVYLARWLNEGNWTSLTIPKGQSSKYNQAKFGPGKRVEHFTKNLHELK